MTPLNPSRNNFLLNLATAALYYSSKGWKVFPCQPKDKKPIIKDWPNKASLDKNQIKDWWKQWPNANVAILTGDGVDVLDVDYSANGYWSMRKIRSFFDFPTVPTVETPNGCHHYFISHDLDIGNKVMFLPGLDWRGKGGYIIAPPSIHPCGESYVWSVKPCR